jgi:glycosyltransferase involved in cell wall biosynthesis
MTYSRNAAVTAVSAAVAESVAGFGGPLAAVVSNGVSVTVDPAEVSAARAELSIDDATELVVAVGNIRPHKGHQNLVETAAVLKEKRPQALVVSIGGEKYPGDLDRLKEAAEAAGVRDTIRFLGRKENAREFIAASDVFVNPSDVEGLPVVILEAMAMGRAIAATAVGGVPSVIEDGETGLLAAPGDPDGLAGAIVRLLEDPHLRTTVGAAAAESVARDHGMAPMIEAFEDIYQRLLSG